MSPRGLLSAAMSLCFPRVSGDEPDSKEMLINSNGFSPRERG